MKAAEKNKWKKIVCVISSTIDLKILKRKIVWSGKTNWQTHWDHLEMIDWTNNNDGMKLMDHIHKLTTKYLIRLLWWKGFYNLHKILTARQKNIKLVLKRRSVWCSRCDNVASCSENSINILFELFPWASLSLKLHLHQLDKLILKNTLSNL